MLGLMGDGLDDAARDDLRRRAAELRKQAAAVCGRAATTVDWAKVEHRHALELQGRLMDAERAGAEVAGGAAKRRSRRRPS
jgi:hypothetical protein